MTPLLSVIVPTYRRPDLLERCLTALIAQTIPASDYEIIVADDAACDATRNQVEQFAQTTNRAIRYVGVTAAHGPSAARNAGWRAARGAIIAFTDDDCVPQPAWLQGGATALREEQADAAWGRLTMPLPQTPTDYERDAAGLATALFVTANCFCRREALERIGGFDEQFTMAWREDSDLYFSLLEAGFRVVPAPAAHVVHPVRPASWGISLKQQKKSQFDVILLRKHPRCDRRCIPPFPRDYLVIVSCLFTGGLFAAIGNTAGMGLAALVWFVLTARFCWRRLQGTSHAPSHVLEMIVTSALIPPLSCYWRLVGIARFGWPRWNGLFTVLAPSGLKPMMGINAGEHREPLSPRQVRA